MTVKGAVVRIQPEGGAEVVRAVREVEAALEQAGRKGVTATEAAIAATDRQVAKLREAALAAAQTETALQRQINAATGVSQGGNLNAAVSARTLGAADATFERRAAALKAELDPAAAALGRLNAEIAEYNALAARQMITTEEAAQAQAMAQARYEQTVRALEGVSAKYREAAAAAREEAAAAGAQSRYNQVLGVGAPTSGSARDSAAVFMAEAEAMDRLEARARALKATLDPLSVAQDNYNDELREADQLLKANLISTDQHSRAQALAAQRLQATTVQLERQNRGLTRNAMASRLNLARQGADVFTTAAMGMNPGMIAIQQGPQILDAWSTSAISLRGPLVMVTGLVGSLAIAAGVLAKAWWDSEKSSIAMDRAATGLGRTAKLTGADLKALADEGAKAGDISIKSAREQAATYVSTGKIGGEIIGGLIAIQKDYASFTGQESVKATEALARSFSEPDKAARELTRAFGLMDQKTLDSIDNLVKQGDKLAAQKLLLEALSKAVEGHGDRVSGVTSVWDSLTRSMSNYWTKLGEFLYTTDDEKIEKLTRQLAPGYTQGGQAIDPVSRQRMQSELDELTSKRDAQAKADRAKAEAAAANQAAQAKKDQDDKDKAERDRRKREAEQARREAERRAREALQRQRREEDREAGLNLQIAQATENYDVVRQLESEARVRRHVRELVDDGTSAVKARTKALEHEGRLQEALDAQSARAAARMGRDVDLQTMQLRGEERFLDLATQRVEREDRVAAYRKAGLDLATAQVAADRDLLQLAEARAEAMARAVREAEDQHRLTLARLSGDEDLTRYLEVEDRINRRAREIEQREKLNYGEGIDRAMAEIQEELNAEAIGARRTWMRGLLQDIKRGGIAEALADQLDRATDRWLNKLADSLAELDWGGFMRTLFAGSQNGGGLTSALSALIGGAGAKSEDGGAPSGLGWLSQIRNGSIFSHSPSGWGLPGFGGHSTGTDFSEGGWKWVGERGPELMRVQRGAQVYEHVQSMQIAKGSSGPQMVNLGGLTINNLGSEPLTGRLQQRPDGGLELELEPVFDGMLGRAAKSGKLAKAIRSSPGATKRG